MDAKLKKKNIFSNSFYQNKIRVTEVRVQTCPDHWPSVFLPFYDRTTLTVCSVIVAVIKIIDAGSRKSCPRHSAIGNITIFN